MTKIPHENGSTKAKMNVTYENPAYSPSMQFNNKDLTMNPPGTGLNRNKINGYVRNEEVILGDATNPFIHTNNNNYSSDEDDDDGGFAGVTLPGDGRLQAYDDDDEGDGDAHLDSDAVDEFNQGYTGVTDDGPYREMAIDVPRDFVPARKEPPRLPSSGSNPATPIKAGSAKNDQQLEERVKKYQEDLKKRRELEEKQLNEDEWLRTSLRGSKKLQALEKNRRVDPSGFENAGFEEEDFESPPVSIGSRSLVGSGSLRGSGILHGSVTGPKSHSVPHSPHRKVPDKRREQPLSVESLIVSLNNVKSKLQTTEDRNQMDFLNQFFQNPRFQQSVAIHKKVLETTEPASLTVPVCHDSRGRCQDTYAGLAQGEDRHVRELRAILCKAEFQSLLYAHDRIACQYALPCADDALPDVEVREVEPEVVEDVVVHTREVAIDVPPELDVPAVKRHGDGDVRIVRLMKSTEPLGATVRNDGESVIVGRIVKGGVAEKSGELHEGDEILEVNGQEIRGLNVNDVSDMLASMTGLMTFCVIPCRDNEKPHSSTVLVHVRAHFFYDPEDDLYIPCRELGLSFRQGDILHVINQDDANWWQAYREGEEVDNQLAGLIPSKTFQEQREAMKLIIAQDSEETDGKKKKTLCAKKKKKKKRVMYNAQSDEFDAESIPTYEEVALYYPQPNRKRPVVLIGPPNVGRQELRQRLMESDANRFAAAVPHTSRPRKETEQDGQDYHFIPRQVFEADIVCNKFIEHGEYENNLYGTSIAAVQVVIQSGRVCILNVHPQSLKVLKASKLKPYIVFIAPPNLEKLRMNCHQQSMKVSEDGLKEIITKSREMEENFGHYFDYCLVNYEMDRTFDEILAEINRLDMEPQWVPAHWMRD